MHPLVRRVVLLSTSTLLLACGDPPAEVVISTRVETPIVPSEPEAESEPEIVELDSAALADAAARTLGRAARWWTVFGSEPSDGVVELGGELISVRPVLAPPSSPAEFEAALAAIRSAPVDELAGGIRNLAAADPAVWPRMRSELLAPRKHGKREYKLLLSLIGGDVPNRYGTFELRWKKTHGFAVKLSENWFEDLLAVEPGRVTKVMQPVLRETLLTTAMLQAAPRIALADGADPERVADVVAALLDAAYVHEGTFRDEVGRAIDAIGDPAIPSLMANSVVPDDAKEGEPEERRATYATYCLDRMDRLQPQRAIEAAADDRRLLASVLNNFALTRDGEAAPLLLEWVDNDAPGVRRASRDAFDAYVSGPLPKTRRKAIRLLGGKMAERNAELGYREQARLAIRGYLAEHEPDLLAAEPECRLILAENMVDPICERQPERLFRALVVRLDEARATRRDARVAAALSQFDRDVGAAMLDELLTEGAEPRDPAKIAGFYSKVATELADQGERARAAQLLRKSSRLVADVEPIRARELTVAALVLEAEVDGVDERGRDMLLATAERLDPGSDVIAASAERIAVERDAADGPVERRLSLALLGLLGALGLANAVGRRLGPRLA